MEPGLSGRVRGAVPWGLIGLIGLVALTEWTLTRLADDFTTLENLNWRLSSRAARRREATQSRILCFGTSMMQLGVVPSVIEAGTGRRTFNLAVCAGPPQADEALLRRTLDAGARPSAILVDFHPHSLQVPVGPRWTIAYWPDLATAQNSLELAWTTRDPDFFTTVMLSRLLPSLKDRHQARTSILGALDGESKSMRTAALVSRRQHRRNRGAYLVPKNPNYRGEVRADYEPTLLPDAWSCAPINELYVRRFLDLAGSRGTPVFWLIPPFAPELQGRREQKGLDDLYTRFARAIQAQYPNLVVIDGRHSGYAASVFIDAVHLDRQGAAALSAGVAEVLDQHFKNERQGPRWINLPLYQDPAIDPPLEDMIQSALALRAAAESRKR